MSDATAYFDDTLHNPDTTRALWCSVLHQSILDATTGPIICNPTPAARRRGIEEARRYLTHPNVDFNEVCYLAGLDPEAVREHAIKVIAAAPSVDELMMPKKKRAKTADIAIGAAA